jgi:hypothetical protein
MRRLSHIQRPHVLVGDVVGYLDIDAMASAFCGANRVSGRNGSLQSLSGHRAQNGTALLFFLCSTKVGIAKNCVSAINCSGSEPKRGEPLHFGAEENNLDFNHLPSRGKL